MPHDGTPDGARDGLDDDSERLDDVPESADAAPEILGPVLRLGVVPGVNPGRWVDTWRGRHHDVALQLVPLEQVDAEPALLQGEVDAAFLRLPLASELISRIPLWTEETVVALSRESELTLLEELTEADLLGEILIVPADDVLGWHDAPGERFGGRAPLTTSDALELVAVEAGICVLPKAVARQLHRRDVELRPLLDAPTSQVGLAWLPVDHEPTALVEQLIGIVRGRTENSTRGKEPTPPTPRRSATRTATARRTGGAVRGGGGARGGRPGTGRGGGGKRR